MDNLYNHVINFHKIFNFTLVTMNKDGMKAIDNNSYLKKILIFLTNT